MDFEAKEKKTQKASGVLQTPDNEREHLAPESPRSTLQASSLASGMLQVEGAVCCLGQAAWSGS